MNKYLWVILLYSLGNFILSSQETKALKILVKYKIINDFDKRFTTPDIITLNGKSVLKENVSFVPGNYIVKIKKQGFRTQEFSIRIKPSKNPYIIKTKLISIRRDIELITYYQEEKVYTEIASFNGRGLGEEGLKPGKYLMDIQEPGCFPIKEKIVIPPGKDCFRIERILKAKVRKVKENIFFDVAPPKGCKKHKITLAPLDRPKAEKIYQSGDKIQPGIYILRITKPCYRNIEKKKYIEPAEEPVLIKEKMLSKDVKIHIDISYDVAPPKLLHPYKVSLIDKESGIARFVEHGKHVKPGEYYLMVQRPGYSFGIRKEIEIVPSEKIYYVKEKLFANSRNLAFGLEDPNSHVFPYKIIDFVTRKEITFKDTYKPGTWVDLIVKYKRHKTTRVRFRMTAGEGPFVPDVNKIRLRKYEFFSKRSGFQIDGIEYPYEFYSNGKKIEKHHMKIEKGTKKYYVEMFVPSEDNYLQVYCGYFFIQKRWSRIDWGVRKGIKSWERISIARLTRHLYRVAKRSGNFAALNVIEKILRDSMLKEKLQKSSQNEIRFLMQAVRNLKDSRTIFKQQNILGALKKLR